MTAPYALIDDTERPDRLVAKVASRQFGVVSRAQALSVGLTDNMIRHRLEAGRWERVFPGVYRLAGSARGWEQGLMSACLAAGKAALASHRAAGSVWRLPSFEQERLEIVVPGSSLRVIPGVIVHRTRDISRGDRSIRCGLPVTSPTRTLVDLAGVVPVDLLEEALDDAFRRRITGPMQIMRRLDALGRGRSGTRVLRGLLERRLGLGIPESPPETRLLRLIRSARLPIPVVQWAVFDGDRFVGRVDLAYPDERLAIEFDGFEFHFGRARFDADRARLSELAALGWRVVLVTATAMRDEPDALIERIRRGLTLDQ